MPRKRKNKINKGAQNPAKVASHPNSIVKKSVELKELNGKLDNIAKPEDYEIDEKDLKDLPTSNLDELLLKSSKIFQTVEKMHKRLESDISKKEKAIDTKTKRLDSQQKGLDEDNAELKERQSQLRIDEEGFQERLEEIIKRELDADAGFLQRNRESLEKLEKEGKDIQNQFSEQRKKIHDERLVLEKEIQEKRDQITKQSNEAWKKLNEEKSSEHERYLQDVEELEKEKKKIKQDQKKLDLEREMFEEDAQFLELKVQQFAAREIEKKDSEIRALHERLEISRQERNRFSAMITEFEDLNNRFGELAPEEILSKLRDLEIERDNLKKELGSRPRADSQQRLDDLVRQKELWETDKLQLMVELGELRQEASRKRIAVTELESLRDEKRALESANALLTEAITQLVAEVDTLVKGVEGKSTFPTCSEMDANNELQNERPTKDEITDLEAFAEGVRDRMAFDPKTGKELYYSKEDVRSFLGGLAMSRLHLLQGISGTGKTSLPLAFARAIGARSEIIEVQAGWRDRQDLIGHFNTFERRFYESKFLQALYLASTPFFRDTPFIIVMDEMNLSHPEQYFADMLSALEQDKNRQRIILMTASVDPSPRLLSKNGKELRIPENVWFVGTANHDETTKDFADKTYDRAHVMELPRHTESFVPSQRKLLLPISLKALHNSFDSAIHKYQSETAKAYEFLHDNVGDILGQRFQVGWGNRLERQMGFYVPVVISAGGNVGEATDHILATKLLRKIRDRHDNRPEDIMALRDKVKNEWMQLDRNSQPNKSMALLKQELHRLGHDEE
jgi:hypothetical protein